MATLATITSFAVGQPSLFTLFKAARLQVAWNVLAENAGVPTALRKAWAVKVMTNYDQDDGKEYRWFLSHSLVQAAGSGITDANCITAVASFVDSWD
jgi:cell wall-associated NlpC family hydrolase